MIDNIGLLMGQQDCHYNTRTKFYIDENGNKIPYETMICNRQIFSDGVERSEITKDYEWRQEYELAAEDIYFGRNRQHYIPEKKTREDLLDASRRRAKRKLFDYIICNHFDCFVTLTLDGEKIERCDYQVVIKKLNNFLGNRVKRKGLKYVGVPEYHKKGGIHFHFACNASALQLEDSGTVAVDGKKKPIKIATANRQHIPEEKRHTVYNVVDWRLGFSTAIRTYGDRGALAGYLSKELCKGVQKAADGGKIGGRWYLSGGKLNKPIVEIYNSNYADITGESYHCSTEGGEFKVFKFDNSGVVLR